MVRRSSALLPPIRLPLLLAVGALLGPGVAAAGGPAPDAPSPAATPAPDPAPVARPNLSRAPVMRTAPAAALSTPHIGASAVSAPTPPRTAHPPARRVHKHPVHAAVRVVDVPPLQVDVHRGLGAVAPSLRDNSPTLLAGIALLVAASVAASALALTLVAARTPGSAT